MLLFFNFFSWNVFFYLKDNSLKVVFFDVGQGDSIFIKTPQNYHILIDGGPGSVVLEKLEKELPFFFRSIDLLVLTHPHYDHYSGLFDVLERYKVKNILYTGVLAEESFLSKWNKLTEDKEKRTAFTGQRIILSNSYFNVLSPTERLKGKEAKDLNETSIVLRLTSDDYSFLFMGDATSKEEKEIIKNKKECQEKEYFNCDIFAVKSNVLKVGHHGSKNSSIEDFIKEVSPDIAVIMVGANNKYNHPHKEVLERLKNQNIEIKRTDKDGDIVFLLR